MSVPWGNNATLAHHRSRPPVAQTKTSRPPLTWTPNSRLYKNSGDAMLRTWWGKLCFFDGIIKLVVLPFIYYVCFWVYCCVLVVLEAQLQLPARKGNRNHSMISLKKIFFWQGDNKEQCSTNSSGIESERTYTSTKNTINKISIKSGDSPNKLANFAMQEKEIQILEKPSPKTESEVCSFLLSVYAMMML